MTDTQTHSAQVVANTAEGTVIATVDVPIPPERAFRALASPEVINWWIRPGVFDTREWTGDVRAGGTWQTAGVARGNPYVLEGKFLVVDSPRKLEHSWHLRGTPDAPTTVTYLLEPHNAGTRITLRHTGFTSPQACENTATGWQTSFDRLMELFAEHRPHA